MRKTLKKNIDCAMTYMTYMAYLDDDGNIYLEIGREEEYKLASVRISKDLSPHDAVRIIRGALWDEVPSGEPKRGRCLPLVLIDATTIRDNMLIRETNWDVMPGNVRREFEKID